MRLFSFVASVALLGVPSLPTYPTPTAEHFHLVVARTPAGYRLDCQTGCHWTTLSFGCDSACNAVVDDRGVAAGVTAPQASDTRWAFHFHRTPSGWAAESLGGTAWKSLAWDCTPNECAATLDEQGVSGPASAPGA